MNNSISPLKKRIRALMLFALFLLFMACEEFTPAADGYYVVDGKRYDVHIMAIYKEVFPQSSGNNIEVILQGAPAYNIVMFVSVPSNTLSEGDYHISYGYEPFGINSFSLLRGNTSQTISSDINSEGTMTVDITGSDYLMDFDGQIGGHSVQIHYSGLVSIQ
jgi:hypothetical protein